MLVSDLILAVLPRVGRADKSSGISIFGAANSLQSLIYKNLLRSKSDLLATGQLNLSIPAFGYSAILPSDFLSPAERLRTEELMDDWMAGTVVSYGNTTGILVVNVTLANGTDVLAYWDIALGPTPGSPASNVANSVTSLTCGTGTQTLTTQEGLNLQVGQYIILSSAVSPNGWEGRRRILEPNYLGDDENDHEHWWEYYGFYGVWDAPFHKPQTYTIVGSAVYIRPKPTVDVLLKGKYNQIPATLALTTDTIPWQGKFDELFKEGVMRIMAKGSATLEADMEFMAFFGTEFDSVMISRGRLIPAKRRTHRSNFM